MDCTKKGSTRAKVQKFQGKKGAKQQTCENPSEKEKWNGKNVIHTYVDDNTYQNSNAKQDISETFHDNSKITEPVPYEPDSRTMKTAK